MAKSKVYYPTTNDPHAPVVDQYGKVSRPQNVNNPQMQSPLQPTPVAKKPSGTAKKTTSGTTKQTSSTATSIGNQTPYQIQQQYTSAGTYDPEMYQLAGTYSPDHYTLAGTYDPEMYQAGDALQWENYQYTPEELLKLNQYGTTDYDENALGRIKNEWGQSGYVDAVNSARQNSLDATNRQYNDNARNYYQQYMANQNKLPEQLSRLGINGGASETASLGLLNNYSGNLYGNESARAQQVSNLNAQYDQLVADNSRQLAQTLIDTYLNMYGVNRNENWSRESRNNQGLNEANMYNNQGRNAVNETNWTRRNTVNDKNVDLRNGAQQYNLEALQAILNGNVDIDNSAQQYNLQALQAILNGNTDLRNGAQQFNLQNAQDILNNNTALTNDYGKLNTDFNVGQMQTLQGYAQQEAQAQQERMYDVANYLLQNGGDASMLKTILGLSDSQAKALVKAWKKAQKSGGSSGGSSGGGRGYYGGGSSGTSADAFPDVADESSETTTTTTTAKPTADQTAIAKAKAEYIKNNSRRNDKTNKTSNTNQQNSHSSGYNSLRNGVFRSLSTADGINKAERALANAKGLTSAERTELKNMIAYAKKRLKQPTQGNAGGKKVPEYK